MSNKPLKLMELTDRLARAEVYQQLQYEIADIIHLKDAPPEHTAPDILKTIAVTLGYELGVFWRRVCDDEKLHPDLHEDNDCDVMTPVAIWTAPTLMNGNLFVSKTKGIELKRGESLPGRIWASGTAVWLTDISDLDAAEFPRAKIASQLGLNCGIAFPVAIDSKVIGVIEFYAPEIEIPPDQSMLDTMTNIGLRVGQYLRRKELEEELLETQLRYRAIFESAPNAIIVADADGNIVDFNRGAERMFGYSADDIQGKSLAILMPEKYRADHNHGIERIKVHDRTEGSRVIGRVNTLDGLRADGTEFPIELTLATWTVKGTRYYSGIIRERRETNNVSG